MHNISLGIRIGFSSKQSKIVVYGRDAGFEFSNVCLLIVDLGQNYGMLRLNPILNAQFCPCRKMDSAHP